MSGDRCGVFQQIVDAFFRDLPREIDSLFRTCEYRSNRLFVQPGSIDPDQAVIRSVRRSLARQRCRDDAPVRSDLWQALQRAEPDRAQRPDHRYSRRITVAAGAPSTSPDRPLVARRTPPGGHFRLLHGAQSRFQNLAGRRHPRTANPRRRDRLLSRRHRDQSRWRSARAARRRAGATAVLHILAFGALTLALFAAARLGPPLQRRPGKPLVPAAADQSCRAGAAERVAALGIRLALTAAGLLVV